MTNEELAARVKAGEPGAMLELWEAVRRTVEIKARQYARQPFFRVSYDDLVQSGFLAMLDTAEQHDPQKGCFNTLFPFFLKSRFSEVAGVRNKLDALHYASSLDEPAETDEGEAAPAVTNIVDEGAALAFMGVEYANFLTYCRGIIGAALETVGERQAVFLREYYLKGRTLPQAAEIAGIPNEYSGKRALYRLATGKYSQELRECLEAFGDFHSYHSAAKGNQWKETGLSQTEAAALVR